jgi:hypothetical protein
MTYTTFKEEVAAELMESGMTLSKATETISNCSNTIKGCYDREMTPEQTVNLLLNGFED